MAFDTLIVGAGLAGLCCARRLGQAGKSFHIIEASDGVGGRIRTDLLDGFRLDRGFQVFLDSYPEAKQVLDFQQLGLKAFLPGASIRFAGKYYQLTDPWRRPFAPMPSVFSPIGTLADKLRIAKLRYQLMHNTLDFQFAQPETTTQEFLQATGFSHSIIERFFRPFLGGIFLDADLQTSSRMFRFVFRLFSIGSACLPMEGMEAIPRQIASGLPAESIRLGSKVSNIKGTRVYLESGEIVQAKTIVVATESPVAATLLNEPIRTEGQGTTCIYFAANRSPVKWPILILNGDGKGPINNLCVPSLVAPSYAPPGQYLVSATILGAGADPSMDEVYRQLKSWFGRDVDLWRHLRTYRIPHALPRQTPPALSVPERSVRIRPGVYICGDHRDNASIQGAMVSGRRAAEAILEDSQWTMDT